MKRIVFISIIFMLSIVPATAGMLPSWNAEKNMNILCILKRSDNVNFYAVRYSTSENFIKICFIDENVVVQSKKRKVKTLKDVFFEAEESKQISTAKTELEKIFNNNIKFDNYICFDDKFLNKTANIFFDKNFLSEKEKLLNIFYSDDDRYNANIAFIKIINGIYGNINRWNIIKLLKSFYKKDFLLKTNFNLKEFFLAYPKILNEDKSFKYADVPVVMKRSLLKVDAEKIDKIVNFFYDDIKNYDNSPLRIEVLNTTNKSRLAIKTANKLRANNFDVFDWGAISKNYKFTVIFDFINNYESAIEIKKILNCGEVFFKPEDRDYTDISVQLGEDCVIYDKLDRTTGRLED